LYKKKEFEELTNLFSGGPCSSGLLLIFTWNVRLVNSLAALIWLRNERRKIPMPWDAAEYSLRYVKKKIGFHPPYYADSFGTSSVGLLYSTWSCDLKPYLIFLLHTMYIQFWSQSTCSCLLVLGEGFNFELPWSWILGLLQMCCETVTVT